MTEATPSPKRQEIVTVARDAFYRLGFRGTAVDRVLADSGISKRTVYKHFRSKEELIAAVVQDYERITLAAVDDVLAQHATARAKIAALFDMRADIIASGDVRGCMAINARLEFRDEDEAIAQAACAFNVQLKDRLVALCGEDGCANPAQTGLQILVLLLGTIVGGQSLQDKNVAWAARAAAQTLLDADHKK